MVPFSFLLYTLRSLHLYFLLILVLNKILHCSSWWECAQDKKTFTLKTFKALPKSGMRGALDLSWASLQEAILEGPETTAYNAAHFPKPVCLDEALFQRSESLHMFGTFLFSRYKMKAVRVMHSQRIANIATHPWICREGELEQFPIYLMVVEEYHLSLYTSK